MKPEKYIAGICILQDMTEYGTDHQGKSSFHVTKWYMDICDDSGNVFIGYHVTVRWRKLKFGYNGILFLDNQNKIFTDGSLGDTPGPVVIGDSLTWNNGQVNGTWRNVQPGISETVHLPGEAQFHWECNQPLARAQVEIKNRAQIEGMGYTEKIELTIAPWKLPITTLYWGRFTAPEHSVVWIQWKGNFPLTIVYVNGKRFHEANIDENGIQFPGGKITFGKLRPIRTGKLSETVLSGFNRLRKLFPITALSIEEKKWTCGATLELEGSNPVKGFTIHETVNFPQR